MKLFFPVLLLLGCIGASAQPHYFQQKVDYLIDVSLNEIDKALDGFEVIHYTNNSPDTLHFIWFHLWPNAYKNDRTAFSEQMLQIGRTDFYFSSEEKRGYINRLDFKVNNVSALLEDHPQYIDVAKLVLPSPLPPGQTIRITTPFHVKIPFNFSRGGYVDETFQMTQWYPKPAVYDRKGWHPMPYLDQGEFYSEFGDYTVNITLPKSFKVAATGNLTRDTLSGKNQQLQFVQKNVHDFAWFADKNFVVKKDTLALPSGRVINVAAYYSPDNKEVWKHSLNYLKKSILTRSQWLGEYPFDVVTAVEAKMGFSGGMEYPTITSISPMSDPRSLELTIEHEVGHNWNYGILASNERDHPWMDEGINSYYDARYEGDPPLPTGNFFKRRMPTDFADVMYRAIISEKTDQPIETTSEAFTDQNYGLIAYYKTSLWMKKLEQTLGRPMFDSAMRQFYRQWQFKHPQPEDFKESIEATTGENLDVLFALQNVRGALSPAPKKEWKLSSFYNFTNTDKYNYLFVAPAIGFNHYDQFMLGGIIHNYTLPLPKFNFVLVPMYSTQSKHFTGIGKIVYDITSYGWIRKTELSVSGETFSRGQLTDSTGKKNFLPFTKWVPSIKLTFRNKIPNQWLTTYLQWKTYFIEETNYLFTLDTLSQGYTISYPKSSRIINQLTFGIENNRALYPYQIKITGEQSTGFIRLGLEAGYFFNYAKGGGLTARLFAGKFIYTSGKDYGLSRYYLNMTGPKGDEDYTYSNYFVGRNEFAGASSQQIMIRDGGFKVRTDLLYNKIGRSDDWLSALNLETDIPNSINPLQVLPFKIPLKVFLDIGTYSEAWKKNATTDKFLFDAGLLISVLQGIVNVYIPILYSKVYSDYFKSFSQENTFWKRISFSIDIQKFRFRNLIK